MTLEALRAVGISRSEIRLFCVMNSCAEGPWLCRVRDSLPRTGHSFASKWYQGQLSHYLGPFWEFHFGSWSTVKVTRGYQHFHIPTRTANAGPCGHQDSTDKLLQCHLRMCFRLVLFEEAGCGTNVIKIFIIIFCLTSRDGRRETCEKSTKEISMSRFWILDGPGLRSFKSRNDELRAELR